jgi:hypothetical protein
MMPQGPRPGLTAPAVAGRGLTEGLGFTALCGELLAYRDRSFDIPEGG